MHFFVASPRQNSAVWSNVKQELSVLCSQKPKISHNTIKQDWLTIVRNVALWTFTAICFL